MADDLVNGLLAYPSVLVKQKPRGAFLEYCCGWEVSNEYAVYNPQQGNEKILVAKEESSCLARQCLGPSRPYEMALHTVDAREVIHYTRPYRLRQGGWCCCCCEFGFQVVKAFSGANSASPGSVLGEVRENYSFCQPVFSVFNGNHEEVYRIIGNCCGCWNWTFKIYDRHGGQEPKEECGVIQKTWAGLAKELFTDADNFFHHIPP